MGFSSFNCKHCGHSILNRHSVDPEINAWMKEMVVLSSNGSRLIEKDFSGYAGEYEEFFSGDSVWGLVWVHQACWEVAGKPEYDKYDGPSQDAADQGHFFDDEHDMIDPRITDESVRAKMLEDGKAARAASRYDARAKEVFEWMKELEQREDPMDKDPWEIRYLLDRTLLPRDTPQAPYKVDPLRWTIRDLFTSEKIPFAGTEEEAFQQISALWAHFVEGEECKAYLNRANELLNEERANELERLKEQGLYRVGIFFEEEGDSVIKGDGRTYTLGCHAFKVYNELTLKTEAIFNEPLSSLDRKAFEDSLPTERLAQIKAAEKECQAMAEAEALRLNKRWAAEGYPVNWAHL